MAKPYSDDFRQKVMQAIELDGLKKSEMAQLWDTEVSQPTISRAIEKIRHTRKKMYGYVQRDEAKRAEFMAHLEDPKAPYLVYGHEAGIDERDNYGYGYSPAEDDLKSGRRQGRMNMIAGYRDRQLIAPFTVEGVCNRSVFETWLEICLIPVFHPGE